MKEDSSKQERTWAMFCHLAAFAGYVFPMGHIIAPLIVYLINKEDFPLVEDQGKESLNFQISITIYISVAILLIFVLIGVPILIGLLVFHFIMVIVATVRANDGEAYRYPITIRFIR